MKKLNMNKSKDITLEEALEGFMRFCKVKNLADKTLEYYTEALSVFTDYIKDDSFEMNQITLDNVESYILHIKSFIKSSTSINSRIRAARAFLYWCMEREYTRRFKIRLIKEEAVIKDTFTDAELSILLAKPAIKTCDFTEYRNWVIVNFFFGSAVRLSTLINIKIGDIDLNNNLFKTTHNKNRKEMLLPLTSTLVHILGEYMNYRESDNPDDYLFCTIYGKKMTVTSTGRAILKYSRRRGIENCNPHKFRHTFAKRWILEGGDVFRLQKILGHSSMEIVRRYVNMYGNDLLVDFDKFNPLERMQNNKETIKMPKKK